MSELELLATVTPGDADHFAATVDVGDGLLWQESIRPLWAEYTHAAYAAARDAAALVTTRYHIAEPRGANCGLRPHASAIRIVFFDFTPWDAHTDCWAIYDRLTGGR